MKLRIAAVMAAIILAVSLGSWLWVGSDAFKRMAMSAAIERAAQAATIAPAGGTVPRPPEDAATPRADPSAPPPGGSRPVAAVTSPSGDTPPAAVGARTSASPPRPAPPAVPPSPPMIPAPPAAVEPEIAAKAAMDLDKVGLMLRDYRTMMGENPVGTNAEIMRAVMGGNRKQSRLGPPEGQQINGNGELVDRWGTPYFFHQLSKSDMEIRSAGPDMKMWTADDIVGR